MRCARCPREVVQQRAWVKLTPDERASLTARGTSALKARGLCTACYLRAYKAGEVAHTKPGVGGRGRKGSTLRPSTAPHPCARCGVTTRGEMCRDCLEVEAA